MLYKSVLKAEYKLMGFSPLEGLMMGTRCGDIDPEIIFYLSNFMKLDSISVMLNKESGLKGIAG
jgi:acetate kinase